MQLFCLWFRPLFQRETLANCTVWVPLSKVFMTDISCFISLLSTLCLSPHLIFLLPFLFCLLSIFCRFHKHNKHILLLPLLSDKIIKIFKTLDPLNYFHSFFQFLLDEKLIHLRPIWVGGEKKSSEMCFLYTLYNTNTGKGIPGNL